jgi:hypothetical protein
VPVSPEGACINARFRMLIPFSRGAEGPTLNTAVGNAGSSISDTPRCSTVRARTEPGGKEFGLGKAAGRLFPDCRATGGYLGARRCKLLGCDAATLRCPAFIPDVSRRTGAPPAESPKVTTLKMDQSQAHP